MHADIFFVAVQIARVFGRRTPLPQSAAPTHEHDDWKKQNDAEARKDPISQTISHFFCILGQVEDDVEGENLADEVDHQADFGGLLFEAVNWIRVS